MDHSHKVTGKKLGSNTGRTGRMRMATEVRTIQTREKTMGETRRLRRRRGRIYPHMPVVSAMRVLRNNAGEPKIARLSAQCNLDYVARLPRFHVFVGTSVPCVRGRCVATVSTLCFLSRCICYFLNP